MSYYRLCAGDQIVGIIHAETISDLQVLNVLAELSRTRKGHECEIDLCGSYQATQLFFDSIRGESINYYRVSISVRAEFTMMMIRFAPELANFSFLHSFIFSFNKSYGTRLRTRGDKIEFYRRVEVIYNSCAMLRKYLVEFDPAMATEEEKRQYNKETINGTAYLYFPKFKLCKYHHWSCLDIVSFLPYIEKMDLLIFYMQNPDLRQYMPCIEMPPLQKTRDILNLVYINSHAIDRSKMIPILCEHYGKNILYFWPDNQLHTRSVVIDKIHHCFSIRTPTFNVITEKSDYEADHSRVLLKLLNLNLFQFLTCFKLPMILEFRDDRFYRVDNVEYDDGKITFLQNEKDITDNDISVDIWSRPGVIISASFILHETPL